LQDSLSVLRYKNDSKFVSLKVLGNTE